MTDHKPRTYKVTQLGSPNASGIQKNISVTDFDSLVTHHPKSNRNAAMIDGRIIGVEKPQKRSHAYISGEFQEVETLRTDEYAALGADQVLLIKDFILEDQPPTSGSWTRAVDVPSPVNGYISRRDDRNAMIEISDAKQGNIIARVRHIGDISVNAGDAVIYGQALGRQDNHGLGLSPGKAIHVHMEIDTNYYQQYENYISDLTSGRLPVQAEYRDYVEPQPVIDDGTFRLGQSSDRIRDLQRVMASEGYRSASGEPLDQDGVYRPSMQGALLDFQRAHGLPQTGDIDPATLSMAPPAPRRETDRHDYTVLGRTPHVPVPEPRAPGHPGHPDHRRRLSDPLPAPVNQSAPGRRSPADRDHPDHAMLEQIREGIRKIDEDIGKPYDETSERLGRCLLPECKDRGLRRVDHMIMGRDGANLFAVQGLLKDPAHLRAHVSTEQAIRTPVEQSDGRLQAVNQSIAQQKELARQQELARGPENTNRGGPVMR